MSKKIFVPALIAAFLSTSIPAFAQDRDYHGDRNGYQQRDDRNNGYAQRDDRNGYQRDDRNNGYAQRDDRNGYSQRDDRYHRDNRWQNDRREDRHAYRQQGGWGRGSDFSSGYDGWGPDHNMHRGDRLPSRYRNHQYVVDNWRLHHLSAPPRGHRWVQVGSDYLLVAAATGLIVSAMSGN
jgi:Ni/Co efflux regulator RcnB